MSESTEQSSRPRWRTRLRSRWAVLGAALAACVLAASLVTVASASNWKCNIADVCLKKEGSSKRTEWLATTAFKNAPGLSTAWSWVRNNSGYGPLITFKEVTSSYELYIRTYSLNDGRCGYEKCTTVGRVGSEYVCLRSTIYINRYNSACTNTAAKRRWLMCHEVAHAHGLQHGENYGCMQTHMPSTPTDAQQKLGIHNWNHLYTYYGR
jgi:hypothetical protein